MAYLLFRPDVIIQMAIARRRVKHTQAAQQRAASAAKMRGGELVRERDSKREFSLGETDIWGKAAEDRFVRFSSSFCGPDA